MTKTASKICFKAKLCRLAESAETRSWSFLVLPKNASAKLPSRGMTAIEGTLNGFPFQASLEPDGQKSHWLKVDRKLSEAAGAEVGDVVTLEIAPAAEEPEPAVPSDLRKALAAAAPKARACSDWCDKHLATLGQPVDAAIFFQFRRGDRSGSGSNRLLLVHDRGLRKSHAGHVPSIQLTVLACPRSRDAWRSDRRRYSRHIGSCR
jgi:hypothetical protein